MANGNLFQKFQHVQYLLPKLCPNIPNVNRSRKFQHHLLLKFITAIRLLTSQMGIYHECLLWAEWGRYGLYGGIESRSFQRIGNSLLNTPRGRAGDFRGSSTN
ncbi:hypothetical protein CEXT_359731 [Caerostris extrusa]|uniref:Uncharacterized protein n=1 Tax=Caerostris extrusa TaxID=172846 RepID=A0AAV4VKQ2_CAEEX|nr:hypothetical protein CEXT_359731 [Caerostris extrusa]